MASPAQIAANCRNAQLSTGPRSIPGKEITRTNSTKHGLSGRGVVVLESKSEEFDRRRAAFAEKYRPQTDDAAYHLDRAVAASIRIVQCEDALDGLSVQSVTRARLTWDLDRRAEAAALAEGLAKRPRSVVRQLESTRQGAELLIEAWDALGSALGAEDDWSAAERSHALDLLGVEPEHRRGRTRADAPEGASPADHRRDLARSEADRLRRLKSSALDRLDDLERRQAEAAVLIVLDKGARLIHRYESEAWRRMERSIKRLQSAGSTDDDDAPSTWLGMPEPIPTIEESTATEPEPAEPEGSEAEDIRLLGRHVAMMATLRAHYEANHSPLADPDGGGEVEADEPLEPMTIRDVPKRDALGRKLNRHERRALLSKSRRD